MSEDVRLVLCERCATEGRIIRVSRPNPPWSFDPVEEDCGECPDCEGAGQLLVEVEPIELEDIEGIPL